MKWLYKTDLFTLSPEHGNLKSSKLCLRMVFIPMDQIYLVIKRMFVFRFISEPNNIIMSANPVIRGGQGPEPAVCRICAVLTLVNITISRSSLLLHATMKLTATVRHQL